jgi:hypothetical protein
MKDLSLKEILELAAQKFRECSESPEEIENLDETIAEIVKINNRIKKSKEENERKSNLRKTLLVRAVGLNTELEIRLSNLGYRKDLFKFEVNEEDYFAWEKVELIDYNGKTILLKNVHELDDFEKWSEEITIKIETLAYLVSEFYDRLAQEGSEVDGLRIKHRNTYHCLEILPTFKAGYVHVYERLPLEIEQGRYAGVNTSEDSWVRVHGDNLVASFEYRKSDVPVNEIDDVMDEIDRLYNSVKGE